MNPATLQLSNPLRPFLVLLALITICIVGNSGFAQSISRRPPAIQTIQATDEPTTPTSNPDSAGPVSPANKVRANPASNVRRDRSLESLSELLELTKSNLRSNEQAESAFRDDADHFKKRNEARIESIHERIFLIRKLIDQKKTKTTPHMRDASSELPTESAMVEDSSSNPEFNDSRSKHVRPEESLTASNPASPIGSSSLQADPDQPQTVSTEPSVDDASDWGTRIATEPVDSIELASSLFMTGNYEGAKKTCQARLRSEVDPDLEAWLRCMIGCCERIMGDYANAEASFRDITNNRPESYPVDYARWNLGYIRQRQEMQQQFENVTSSMDAIIKEVKQP